MLLLLLKQRQKKIVCQLTRNEVCCEMDCCVSVTLVGKTEAAANESPTMRYVYIIQRYVRVELVSQMLRLFLLCNVNVTLLRYRLS